MGIDWLMILVWIWCGGTLPIMAGAALSANEDDSGMAILAALFWPVFVGYVFWACLHDNR